MSSVEISMYNSTFTKYSGEQTGANVKSLISDVIAQNQKNMKKYTGTSCQYQIEVYDENSKVEANKLTEFQSKINSYKKYTVVIQNYYDDVPYQDYLHYVKTICIKPV